MKTTTAATNLTAENKNTNTDELDLDALCAPTVEVEEVDDEELDNLEQDELDRDLNEAVSVPECYFSVDEKQAMYLQMVEKIKGFLFMDPTKASKQTLALYPHAGYYRTVLAKRHTPLSKPDQEDEINELMNLICVAFFEKFKIRDTQYSGVESAFLGYLFSTRTIIGLVNTLLGAKADVSKWHEIYDGLQDDPNLADEEKGWKLTKRGKEKITVYRFPGEMFKTFDQVLAIDENGNMDMDSHPAFIDPDSLSEKQYVEKDEENYRLSVLETVIVKKIGQKKCDKLMQFYKNGAKTESDKLESEAIRAELRFETIFNCFNRQIKADEDLKEKTVMALSTPIYSLDAVNARARAKRAAAKSLKAAKSMKAENKPAKQVFTLEEANARAKARLEAAGIKTRKPVVAKPVVAKAVVAKPVVETKAAEIATTPVAVVPAAVASIVETPVVLAAIISTVEIAAVPVVLASTEATAVLTTVVSTATSSETDTMLASAPIAASAPITVSVSIAASDSEIPTTIDALTLVNAISRILAYGARAKEAVPLAETAFTETQLDLAMVFAQKVPEMVSDNYFEYSSSHDTGSSSAGTATIITQVDRAKGSLDTSRDISSRPRSTTFIQRIKGHPNPLMQSISRGLRSAGVQ